MAFDLSAPVGQTPSLRAVDRLNIASLPFGGGSWAARPPHPPASSTVYDHSIYTQARILARRAGADFNINESLLLALQQRELL